eukprot:1487319-Prymnesium_polylepis.1
MQCTCQSRAPIAIRMQHVARCSPAPARSPCLVSAASSDQHRGALFSGDTSAKVGTIVSSHAHRAESERQLCQHIASCARAART